MNVLIYAPFPEARQKIIRHLIDIGDHQTLIGESIQLIVSLALYNEIHLLVLFDPPNFRLLVDLKDFLRQKRRHMRVRILPAKNGLLGPGWQEAIEDGLKPIRPRKRAMLGAHPRFKWRPGD